MLQPFDRLRPFITRFWPDRRSSTAAAPLKFPKRLDFKARFVALVLRIHRICIREAPSSRAGARDSRLKAEA